MIECWKIQIKSNWLVFKQSCQNPENDEWDVIRGDPRVIEAKMGVRSAADPQQGRAWCGGRRPRHWHRRPWRVPTAVRDAGRLCDPLSFDLERSSRSPQLSARKVMRIAAHTAFPRGVPYSSRVGPAWLAADLQQWKLTAFWPSPLMPRRCRGCQIPLAVSAIDQQQHASHRMLADTDGNRSMVAPVDPAKFHPMC